MSQKTGWRAKRKTAVSTTREDHVSVRRMEPTEASTAHGFSASLEPKASLAWSPQRP